MYEHLSSQQRLIPRPLPPSASRRSLDSIRRQLPPLDRVLERRHRLRPSLPELVRILHLRSANVSGLLERMNRRRREGDGGGRGEEDGGLGGSRKGCPRGEGSGSAASGGEARRIQGYRCRGEMVAFKETELLLNGETMMDDDVEDVDDEELECESEHEEVALVEPVKNAVYNKEGLLEKLDDICWPENVEWIHELTVDHDQEKEIDVNDDLASELAFYTQALDGTRQAFEKIQPMGIPFLRPPDYYAEMVKSDSHMLKIKGKLLVEKKKIEEAEERKKAREAKKIAKEVQAQKAKERAKRKKEDIESVKKWRKQRQQSGFARGKDDEMDLGFNAEMDFERTKKRRPGVAPGDRSGGFARKRGNEKGRKKRDFRDVKFGHGGRKGMRKQNTAETTNDPRGFNVGDMSKNKRKKG